MLRPTPGALNSHLLEERPANLPAHLYVHGGRRSSCFSAVLFEREGPRLVPLKSCQELAQLHRRGDPIWLRVMGLADRRQVEAMLEVLQVPPMLLPPLLEVPQRSRVDGLDGALLVVLHRLSFARDPLHLLSSQVGLLLLPNLLITFEEAPSGESFPALTAWLESRVGAVEHRDLDDILHFLVDELLDELFPMLEQIANRLDDLEEAALRDPKPKLLTRAFEHRSNLRTIRNQVWPLRHQIRVLLRQRQQLLGDEALVGFQEMAELVELLFENCELLRHQCDAITQAYAASVGNRMNQVMKTLTILTSIFAPLTFIGGIYGMNFAAMPELSWRYGYLYALVLMALVALIQAYWLWRRGWFQDWTAPR
ncbi:MAG: magnesium/cobalt transporter CorA [Cyanobacteria bacterium]|nr:magnesium/cobalt transporter CorA [Cyanobacteriota bacterium]